VQDLKYSLRVLSVLKAENEVVAVAYQIGFATQTDFDLLRKPLIEYVSTIKKVDGM
jgi:hypothetical protein